MDIGSKRNLLDKSENANRLYKPTRILKDKNKEEKLHKTMKILLNNKTPRHTSKFSINKPVRSTDVKVDSSRLNVNKDKKRSKVPNLKSNQSLKPRIHEKHPLQNKNQAKQTKLNVIKVEEKKKTVSTNTKAKNSNESRLSRREQLERWRAEKGRSLKENCHPLLSRKRPLCKVIASPSYKPIKRNIILPERSSTKSQSNRRHTMMIKKEETVKRKVDRRKTMSSVVFKANIKTPETVKHLTPLKTPWQNKSLSMRNRLDLWMEAKGKTPRQTPYKTPKSLKRRSVQYATHPQKQRESINSTVSTTVTESEEHSNKEPPDELNSTFTIDDTCQSLEEQLIEILNKLDGQNTDVDDIQTDLDQVLKTFPDCVQHANYWICKARLAGKDNDVQRVVCLLEQAYTFDAKPEEMIKEEIVNFLQNLEEQNDNDNNEVEEDFFTKYAITPGRRVHFAVNTMSPLQFKSSIIRFCIIESKSFKKRLNAQIKRKVMTPVRRSVRLQRADLPEFLRSHNKFINSPSQVEDEIIDGEISFRPNKTINTPLNNGWIVRNERNHSSSPIEDNLHKNEMELSFM